MTTLMDTVRIEAPERSPVQPAAPLDCPRDTASVSPIPSSARTHRVSRIPSYPVGANGDEQWEPLADEPWAALAKSSSFE
jgi:hypothetical protein